MQKTRRSKCPACGRVLTYRRTSDLEHFPFCSERCRWVDLGKWFDGEHRISGGEADDFTAHNEPTE